MAFSMKFSIYLLTVLLSTLQAFAFALTPGLRLAKILPRQDSGNSTVLVLSATVTSAQNVTVFQCWQISTPFTSTAAVGVAGPEVLVFPNATSLEYTYIPPRLKGAPHAAPAPQ